MKLKVSLILFLASVFFFHACHRDVPSDINLEQAHNPEARHIIAPGNGTIGIIQNSSVYMYYYDEREGWLADDVTRFNIPDGNRGILSMGMGTIGVVIKDQLKFFMLDAFNEWQEQPHLSFSLPKKYDRLVSMHMPWEIGVLGIEQDGVLDFYFYYDDDWHHDPTSGFSIPAKISSYYPTGEMTIAIVDNQKLGLYFLGPEEGWSFMDHDDFVMLLPDHYQGIIPVGTSRIAVLEGQNLNFYALDLENNRWVLHTDLKFDLPF